METDIKKLLELEERRSKKRMWIFSLIPLLLTILLIIVSFLTVNRSIMEVNIAKEDLEEANRHILELQLSNDSLSRLVLDRAESLGRISSVALQIKEYIDGISPEERNYSEADRFVEFRTLEERIRGDYLYVSESIAKLPNITSDKKWIVIIESNVSLEDLNESYKRLLDHYAVEQVAIFRDNKGIYALSLVGNGTFTRAYNLMYEVFNFGFYYGYCRGKVDWGKDYSFTFE